MSGLSAEIIRVLEAEMPSYRTAGQRAAYRAGLSTAAMICDEVAAKKRIVRESSIISGSSIHTVAKECGDLIWALRERVTVPKT